MGTHGRVREPAAFLWGPLNPVPERPPLNLVEITPRYAGTDQPVMVIPAQSVCPERHYIGLKQQGFLHFFHRGSGASPDQQMCKSDLSSSVIAGVSVSKKG